MWPNGTKLTPSGGEAECAGSITLHALLIIFAFTRLALICDLDASICFAPLLSYGNAHFANTTIGHGNDAETNGG